MRIALQRLKDGNVAAFDLPSPMCGEGEVLVQTCYSVISSGTELSRLLAAKSSLLGKALQRPEEFKRVLQAVKRKGLSTTYTKVSNRLEQYNKIGYSSSGIVVAKHASVSGLELGDHVALAGSGYAVHSEYTTVPANLCVKTTDGLSLKNAAYATIGSIALQGLRQMEPQLGETVIVIGLGLLGQIAVSLLKANGVRVIGVDPVDVRRKTAADAGADYTMSPDSATLVDEVMEMTGNYGVDGVLITASTKSTDPINMAGALARKRGRVIIVGDIGHDFERSNYYEKELTIRMSCSYGAGRYDKAYEEGGIDYPQAYAPWTIARNMKAFMWLVSSGKVGIDSLASHEFGISEAPQAYEKLLENAPDTFSILFRYEHEETDDEALHAVFNVESKNSGGTSVGIIGLGNYAKSFIVPNLDKDLSVDGICARSPSSLVVKRLPDCRVVTTNPDEILLDDGIGTVIVTTRHSTHSKYVIDAIKKNKNVYVEKPAVINRGQLDELLTALSEHGGNLCVGFNRRYSGAVNVIESFSSGKTLLKSRYTVVADEFAPDYWALTEAEGGILIGEVIHFVDLLSQLHKSPVVMVSARKNLKSLNRGSYHITLYFENNTVGEIAYLMGSKIAGNKERIELLYDDERLQLDGFKTVTTAKGKKIYNSKMDMGRERLFGEIMRRFAAGEEVQDLKGILSGHLAVFAVKQSVAEGKDIQVEQAV